MFSNLSLSLHVCVGLIFQLNISVVLLVPSAPTHKLFHILISFLLLSLRTATLNKQRDYFTIILILIITTL